MVGYGSDNGVLVSGEQQFLDAHRLRNTSANAAGMGGVECLDLVAFENSGLAVSSGQVTSGLRSGLEGSRIPPPPVPCAAPVEPPGIGVAGPQSMRQFTAQANLEAGLQGGFHTPRSFIGGQGGFDASGYPVSPGGTVIRPPRL